MEVAKWPTGPNYFTKTNVGAIVRNLESGYSTLGLSLTEEHGQTAKPSQLSRDMSTMINQPALATASDLSDD